MRYLAKINSHITRLAAAVLAVSLGFSGVAVGDGGRNGGEIVGIWKTQSSSEITIMPCDVGYCGYITKVVVPQFILRKYGADVERMRGNIVDGLNKDPGLRSRPIQGLQILSLYSQAAPNRLGGQIYNPEDGKTYEGFLEIVGSDKLRLSGCVLFNLFCRGENWTRVTTVSAL